jgi:ABC-2 type transport system ATP-binding protein
MVAEASIRVEGLVKRFPQKGPAAGGRDWAGEVVATVRDLCRLRAPHRTVLDGVSLEVRSGELFGLLGPNGAGKTTLIKLLTCLLYPDAGTGRVYGFDIRRQRRRVKSAISLVTAGGWLGTIFYLSLRENLEFYARLGGLPEALARARIDEALEQLEIADKAAEHPWSLSAGQLQKMNLAKVYLIRTPVVFLDEPTSHLDPRASQTIRVFVRDVLNRQLGQTIVMSTHYLQEAESMCDRVAILDTGRLVAQDTPASLKRELQGETVVEVKLEGYTPDLGEALRAAPGVREVFEHVADPVAGRATLRVALRNGGGPETVLAACPFGAALGSRLSALGGDGTRFCRAESREPRAESGSAATCRVRSVRRVEPSLEEVFFHRVGRRLE